MKNRKILTILLVLILVFSGVIAAYLWRSGGSVSEETVVVDQAGREVSVPANVDRIVSLWPEATRIVIALNEGDKLVGVDDAESRDPFFTQIYPGLKNLTTLGSVRAGINTEELVSLSPDIIFSDANSPDIADDLQKGTGIPVVCVRINPPSEGGQHSFELLTLMGKILHKEDRADYLKNFLDNKVSEVTNITSGIPLNEREKGYVAFARDPLTTLAQADPLESAGVINVAKSSKQVWYSVNMEQITTWQPDIIFVHVLAGSLGGMTPEEIMSDPQWQEVRAVQNGSVYNVIIGYYGWYPVSMIVNMMQVAKIAYPDQFASLDVLKEGNEMFRVMYGVDDFFTEMVQQYDIYVP